MYRPAKISSFNTTAIQKRTETKIVAGRTVKSVVAVATLRGFFKQKSTGESIVNGVRAVTESITYTTWWKTDLKAGDILTINGADYQVIGNPENVEMRSRYAVLTLSRVEGGA